MSTHLASFTIVLVVLEIVNDGLVGDMESGANSGHHHVGPLRRHASRDHHVQPTANDIFVEFRLFLSIHFHRCQPKMKDFFALVNLPSIKAILHKIFGFHQFHQIFRRRPAEETTKKD